MSFGSSRTPRPFATHVRATVKWYNPTKGFGFVTPNDGSADVFLHVSVVEQAGLQSLEFESSLARRPRMYRRRVVTVDRRSWTRVQSLALVGRSRVLLTRTRLRAIISVAKGVIHGDQVQFVYVPVRQADVTARLCFRPGGWPTAAKICSLDRHRRCPSGSASTSRSAPRRD